MTVPLLEQIDPGDIVNTALRKHVKKYGIAIFSS
jgi:hypothetical protein